MNHTEVLQKSQVSPFILSQLVFLKPRGLAGKLKIISPFSAGKELQSIVYHLTTVGLHNF